MDTFFRDLRYAARKLLHTPGFTLVAVTMLALAIGATTAIFSIVYGVLLKPLPFKDPGQLVAIASENPPGKPTSMSALDFIDYRDGSTSFVGMAAMDHSNVNLTGTGVEPLRLSEEAVGARFFALLGVQPQLGRTFASNEDAPNAPKVVVLSDALWHGRFGGDPRVVGQTISLDGAPYTVIGVAPSGFTYPEKPDIWVPLVWPSWALLPSNRGAHFLSAIGRVKAGVPIEHAREEIAAIAKQLEEQYPESNTHYGGTVQPLQQQIVGDVRPALYAMLGAVGFVLLIACANVANLLLVRAAAREPEIAVRTALGAGRRRIVRQLVTESILLALAGALLGALLATWAVQAVVAFGPAGLPRLDEVAVDGRVLLFTVALALATGVLFGLAPAVHASRADVSRMLREGVRGSSRGGARRTRGALVMIEMALAVVLLVGAGLLLRSFVRLTHVDPGFRTDHVISFNVAISDAKYPYDRNKNIFVAQLSEQLTRLPGTEAAAVALEQPLGDSHMRTIMEIAGRPKPTPGNEPDTDIDPASPDYFRALGIPVIRGRLYTAPEDRSSAPQVVVVNQEFVRRYFPNENPIGRRITLGVTHDTAQTGTPVTSGGEIIGVVGDVKQFGLGGKDYPMTYVPFGTFPQNDISVAVRSSADPKLIEGAIRAAVHQVDADLPIFGLATMDQVVHDSVAQPRFYLLLLSAFAGIALLLAALGIYGVISYTVSQRTRELGIRLALGASHERVVRMVLGQGLWLTLGGILLGLAAAFGLTRLITSLLFGVGAIDPLTFAGVAVILAAVAVLASWLPARRAARVDPVIAMRAE
ncbi:MAG TPA: ABC transporter permease [Gemmatimonadaceae bacterium]|nr:ABC transporter permease [Gemmatimonadaceae bacterium]